MFVPAVLSLLSVLAVVRTEENFLEDWTPYNGQQFDRFDLKLCTYLSDTSPSNVIVSPISVKLLLSMLYEGSVGKTAKELERVLQFSPSRAEHRMKNSAVLRSLQERNRNYEMEVSTKLFVDHKLSPKNWYQRILFLYYKAHIEKTNFTDYRTAAERINSWAKVATHGHIKDLVTQAETLEQAMLLLVNAVYFKGIWKNPFKEADTFYGKFMSPSGEQQVQMMTQSGFFYYSWSPELQAKILRLPYLGNKFAMYIILPDDKAGLDELLKNMDPIKLRELIWFLGETWVEVILPRFKFDFTADLKNILTKLGIREIFRNNGELKGIARSRRSRAGGNLVVSDVIQKAAIEVTETGTVAAAATEFQLSNKFGGQDEVFNASHPFLFFVEDESTATVVFVGKLVSPLP